MNDQAMTTSPVCTWSVVTDNAGRSRLEARWTVPVAVTAHAA